MSARVAIAALLAASVGVPACISADTGSSGLPPMCNDSSDCDQAHGEICDEGVCWGDPPEGVGFAAVLVPPQDRTDLPVATIPALAISPDGTIGGLAFPPSVNIHGRVLLACSDAVTAPLTCGDTASVGAQITVERAPGFAGGPTQSRTVVAAAGIPAGQDAFSFLLPRDPDADYRITIVPDDGDMSAPGPGQFAPPRQLTITAKNDQTVDWTVGNPADLKTIAGCVQDVVGSGAPYAGMVVTALGRWTDLSSQVRASSRSVTDAEGCFSLQVPIAMLDEFDVLVKPAPGAILPTLRLIGEYVRDPADGETLVHEIDPPLVMPTAPAPTTFGLPVEAPDPAGGQEPVSGADVRLTTTFQVPDQPTAPDRMVEVSFTAQAVTSGTDSDDPGVAEVQLYGGADNNRSYHVQVVPPPDSQYASVFGQDISVGSGGAGNVDLLAPVVLGQRAAVTGRIVTHAGDPVPDAPVETRTSTLLQLLTEDSDQGTVLGQLQFPKDTTDGRGSFLVWLDRTLVGRAASYNFDVSPPLSSGGPSWTFEDQPVPKEGDSVDLGDLVLPEASYARGIVLDAVGRPVVGAEVHLYQLPSNDVCADAAELGAECDPPAYLRGVWQSDDRGEVRLVLPDP